MRPINLLIVHCSASDHKEDDCPDKIKLLHTGNKKTKITWAGHQINCKGWSDTGYQIIITQDGKRHYCRPMERPGAHCKGFNKTSIGICLTGLNNFTDAQFEELRKLIDELILEHDLSIIDVLGHNELNKNKTCPNFDLKKVLRG